MFGFIHDIAGGMQRSLYHAWRDPNAFVADAANVITKKGASFTAVGVAAAMLDPASAWKLPLVGMAVGVPISAGMSIHKHQRFESQLINHFRDEIAAYYDIAPKEVTHDHLRNLAFGNEKAGIEPHPFFREVLSRNDKQRWIHVGANVLGALASFATVLARGSGIATGVTSFATTTLGLSAGLASTAGLVGVGLVAGLITMTATNVFSRIGKSLFHMQGQGPYDRLEHLAVEQGRGKEITPDQVMALVTTVNPGIKQEIQERYGVRYTELHKDLRQEIIDQIAPRIPIRDIADKLNHGEVALTELAFMAGGSRSGVSEAIASPENPPLPGLNPGEALGAVRERVASHYRALEEEQQLVDRVLRAEQPASPPSAITGAAPEPTPPAAGYEQSRSERVAQGAVPATPRASDTGWVQRTGRGPDAAASGQDAGFAARYAAEKPAAAYASHLERLLSDEQERGVQPRLH